MYEYINIYHPSYYKADQKYINCDIITRTQISLQQIYSPNSQDQTTYQLDTIPNLESIVLFRLDLIISIGVWRHLFINN